MAADKPTSFDAFLRDAADKRADVRITPAIDEHSGNVVFVARLHGESSGFREYFIAGGFVQPLTREMKGPGK